MSDRHYSLFANNQHPIQLATYNEYNAFLKEVHDKKEVETAEDLERRMEEVMDQREGQLNKAEGESLSIEELSDIYI